MARSIDEARAAIRDVLATSGLSMRALSRVMGRDADYVAAFLDPRRPTRARPTPQDLMAVSDATGIPVVELLDQVWAISPARLAAELGVSGGGPLVETLSRLSATQRDEVADFVASIAPRHEAATAATRPRIPRRQRRLAVTDDFP